MSKSLMIIFLSAGASAAIASSPPQPNVSDFISQIGGSTEFKTLQGSRLSGIGRVASAGGGNRNPSITPDRARDDARLNFGYDFFLPNMSGYRFFKVDNKADQFTTAKAAQAKFAEECASKNGIIEPNDSPVASRFAKDNGERLSVSDNYFSNTVATGVCVGADQQPLGGFVAITRTLKTQVLFVRTNRTAIYAIMGDSIASAATFAEEETERQKQQALAHEQDRKAQITAASEQRKLDAWRKTIVLGTSTNCGLVIDVRGPLVQVQLPGNTTGPSGQRDFWIKRTDLTDHRPVYQCTFGN